MAVIESKGDGFALYNGVKLPSKPEYDEEKYPYLLVAKNTAVSAGQYFLFATTAPRTWDGSKIVYDAHILTAWVVTGGATDWGINKVDAQQNVGSLPASFSALWSNYDIINTTDNTVYLAASEPISLDGMNVIEWDGDTTGLETFAGSDSWCRISEKTDVDVSKLCTFVRYQSYDNSKIVTQEVLTDKNGYWQTNLRLRYVAKASEAYPIVGCFGHISSAQYLQLFAYYPIAEEQPEIDRGTLFILYRMFSPEVFHALTGKTHWSD